MEIPQQIKSFLPNVRIIFVTSHTEYAIDAFELSIFRYVPKNNLEMKLTAAVTDAAKLIELEVGQEYRKRLWHHSRKYLVPLIMLLLAVFVATWTVILWIWSAVLLMECCILLYITRNDFLFCAERR